jgi:hypothetical protein
MYTALLVGLLLAGTAGCATAVDQQQNAQEEQNQELDQNSSDDVQADCFVNFYLTAWEDLNGDGAWDESEPPLESVSFIVRGNYAHSIAGGKAVSDENGEAAIDTWAPGECLQVYSFSVEAEAPEGYRLTTAAEILHDGSQKPVGRYRFGFVSVEE